MPHINLIHAARDAAAVCDLTLGMSRVISIKLAAAAETKVLFRMGDFYELFFEDAVIASQALNLTLTSKRITTDRNDAARVPMAGIPHHALYRYGPKLVEAGYSVVVAAADGHRLVWDLRSLNDALKN